jgi:hypothetical protein
VVTSSAETHQCCCHLSKYMQIVICCLHILKHHSSFMVGNGPILYEHFYLKLPPKSPPLIYERLVVKPPFMYIEYVLKWVNCNGSGNKGSGYRLDGVLILVGGCWIYFHYQYIMLWIPCSHISHEYRGFFPCEYVIQNMKLLFTLI